MKKAILIILALIPNFAGGQEFNSVVDFSVDLSMLSDKKLTRELAENSEIVILEGVISETTVVEGSRALRLLGGEWIGSEEVRVYTCLFYVDAPRWREVFPSQPPENPGPAYVEPDSRVIIAAQVTGWNDDTNEPVAEILDYRVLK